MAELELTMYDVNKQLMNQREPLSDKDIAHEVAGIAAWFSYETDRYFMLLCRELADYTVFNFLPGSKKCYEASQELLECLANRGEVLDISYDNDGRYYSIWLRIDDDSFLYHLFPYSIGVIEV